MRWHYHLGHLPFTKLKQLTLNGEIPKKLAKAKPPKCAGCLFGAMTKIPWRGRETKASHEVFISTKPGECISVNQMRSTEVGFFCTNERETYQKAIQVHRDLCGPLQLPTLYSPSSRQFICQNRCHQTCLQVLLHQARRKNSALSLQQQSIL